MSDQPTVFLTLTEATFIRDAIEADDGSHLASFKRGQAFECLAAAIRRVGAPSSAYSAEARRLIDDNPAVYSFDHDPDCLHSSRHSGPCTILTDDDPANDPSPHPSSPPGK